MGMQSPSLSEAEAYSRALETKETLELIPQESFLVTGKLLGDFKHLTVTSLKVVTLTVVSSLQVAGQSVHHGGKGVAAGGNDIVQASGTLPVHRYPPLSQTLTRHH